MLGTPAIHLANYHPLSCLQMQASLNPMVLPLCPIRIMWGVFEEKNTSTPNTEAVPQRVWLNQSWQLPTWKLHASEAPRGTLK